MILGHALGNEEAALVGQLAWVGVGGVIVASILVTALHVLSRELNPITCAMSEYVHSRYGFVMTLAFVALGSSLLALAGAFLGIALSTQEVAAVILLAAGGVATLLAGIFPCDHVPTDGTKTAHGTVHNVAGFILSPLLVGAMLALSTPWTHPGDNSTLQMIAQGSAVVDTVAWVMLMVVNSITLRVGGLGQRIFMGLVCSSLLLTSIRLLFLSANS